MVYYIPFEQDVPFEQKIEIAAQLIDCIKVQGEAQEGSVEIEGTVYNFYQLEFEDCFTQSYDHPEEEAQFMPFMLYQKYESCEVVEFVSTLAIYKKKRWDYRQVDMKPHFLS